MIHIIAITRRILFDENPQRFCLALVGFIAAFFGSVIMGGIALETRGMLPPPPISFRPNVDCVDEKLRFLHELPLETLENADILAVGSSVTWRNLDFNAWLEVQPDANPLNAAMCYIHIDQTSHFARVMLENMPNVETLLVIVHPRDFESCQPKVRQFALGRDLKAYIFKKRSMVLKYLTNFRGNLIHEIAERFTQPERVNFIATMVENDRFGSSFFFQPFPHLGGGSMAVDQQCMPFVSDLEDAVAEAGARLVLVFMPIMERWADEVDPDRSKHRALHRMITDRVRRESTLVVNATTLSLPNEAFADSEHLLWPSAPILTRIIAKATVYNQGIKEIGLKD